MTITVQKENIEITTLEIKINSIEQFSKTLSEIKITDYPQAVVLKIVENTQFSSTDLAMFVELLSQNELVIIGIQSKNQEIINYANISGIVVFPPFSNNTKNTQSPIEIEKKTQQKDEPLLETKTLSESKNKTQKLSKNIVATEIKEKILIASKKDTTLLESKNNLPPLIIDNEVKSNEQIYSKDRDLIIGNKVCADTEIISNANIFIYDLVQGQVFAGIKGNKKAIIFIHNFEASLVSIAGVYKKFTTIPENLKNKSVNITLSNDKLNFKIN